MAVDPKSKKKKKRWISIFANAPFENKEIGESYVSEPEMLKDKRITLNLMTLLSNPRKQSINIKFHVKEVKEGKGIADIASYEMIPSAVKRLIRRSRDKIDDSFLAKTKSGEVVRVKPIIITNANTYKSEQTRLRMQARELLREYLSKNTFVDFTKDLIDGKISKFLKDQLSKLYPVRSAEIRVIKLVK